MLAVFSFFASKYKSFYTLGIEYAKEVGEVHRALWEQQKKNNDRSYMVHPPDGVVPVFIVDPLVC